MVLVIDHRVPEPDRDAGSRTMLAFVQAWPGAESTVEIVAPASLVTAPMEIGREGLTAKVPLLTVVLPA